MTLLLLGFRISIIFPEQDSVLYVQSCTTTAQDFKHFSDLEKPPHQVKLFSSLDLLQVGREAVLQ